MSGYYMMRLGIQGSHVDQCIKDSYVGLDYGLSEDLAFKFPKDWRSFNQQYIPIWMSIHPEKSKIAAGLACAALWTLGEGLQEGDFIISPDSAGNFHVARIVGPYQYVADSPLPHQRSVQWFETTFERSEMSDLLRKATNSALSLVNLSNFGDEIQALKGASSGIQISVSSTEVEDAATFALEQHLEDFLVQNWKSTSLGLTHEIYSEDGQILGRQFPVDTGRIDILAMSKDRSSLLVVELKRGRASDAVVGQIQRYMGYVKQELAEPGQEVHGVIIAQDDDIKIRRALAVTKNIHFLKYEVSFRLVDQSI